MAETAVMPGRLDPGSVRCSQFLEALYGPEAPGHLVLWRKAGKTSRWLSADRLEAPSLKEGQIDLHFGVALQDQEKALELARERNPERKPVLRRVRGSAKSTVALPALWMDVDIRGPAHTQETLPPTFEEAYELLQRFPLPPSIVVDTGHGLHGYWLFRELWVFEGDRDRDAAAELSRRFQATLQAIADQNGWVLDDTSDLARLLRLPGTLNAKLDERSAVEIVEWCPERRYDPGEFESFLVEDEAPRHAEGRKPVDTAGILQGVPEGQRDTQLFRLACKLRGAGVPRDCAEELVLKAAAACDPPFAKTDAIGKVASVYSRYPAGTDSSRSSAASATLAGEPPRPLHRELPPADPFPTDALGEILGPAARAIQEKTQAPDAICAQSVLAAATLGVQGLADVELPTGAVRPLSSFFLSVASTGERKTSADNFATVPVRDRETSLAADYAKDREVYERDLAVWEQEKRQVLKRRNTTAAEKRAALAELGPKPSEPLLPVLTCPEPTLEGLTKLFERGWPSLGVFSTEGGQFIGGHGMNQDNRLKTAAALSALWDGEPLKRVRAGDPLAVLPGRRLAVHLLVQPGVAAALLSDRVLADQGMLSRILVAAPQVTVGTRLWREVSEKAEQSLRRYQARLSQILSMRLPLAAGTRNELNPRTLKFSPMARKLWIKFADHVEKLMGAGGQYESIRGLAGKLPEHAARLAGMIALFHDPEVKHLEDSDLARGIELAKFYAHEALRLFEVGALDPDLALAMRLLQWLRDSWSDELISLPDIYQRGPRAIRDQSTARKMVQLLQEHGWLEHLSEGGEVAGTKRREVWRIVAP